MKCPICKKDLTDMKYKPFCSKRCADIDLANWFNEKYTFEAVETDGQDLAEPEAAKSKSDCEQY